MQKAKGPGDIPEWKGYLENLTPFRRGLFAQKLGITDRTVFNWANGVTTPSEAMRERIAKIIKRGER